MKCLYKRCNICRQKEILACYMSTVWTAFLPTYSPEKSNSAEAQLVIDYSENIPGKYRQ